MSKEANDIILKNVNLLSKLTEQEVKMMPATEAPLPSIEQVERIVNLVKDIIFPDYMGKRQSDESIRSYHIGECVVDQGESVRRGQPTGSCVYRRTARNQTTALYGCQGDVRQRSCCS